MSHALTQQPRPQQRAGAGTTLAFVGASLALHAVAFWFLSGVQPPALPQNQAVELVMVEVVEPPPPPPPEPEKAPEPETPPEPVKAPPKPAPRPPPIKVAKSEKAPPPPSDAPPPPNDAPPPETPSKPVPLVVGISMSSTTSAGSFAAPVGNTAYGKTGDRATAPSEVKRYNAPNYVPVYQVDRQPQVLGEVKVEYPPEARKAEIEGRVVLRLTIDTEGRVVDAKVLKGGLGYGLEEAALQSMRKARFSPATKGGQPVSTTINWTYTFYLD